MLLALLGYLFDVIIFLCNYLWYLFVDVIIVIYYFIIIWYYYNIYLLMLLALLGYLFVDVIIVIYYFTIIICFSFHLFFYYPSYSSRFHQNEFRKNVFKKFQFHDIQELQDHSKIFSFFGIRWRYNWGHFR